jgi:hypothetical protein
MARLEVPQSLEQLRSSTSIEQQLASLKQLKNDIIGHEQRKEAIIRHGVVEQLVKGLAGSGLSPGSLSGAAGVAATVRARGKKRSSRHGPVDEERWTGNWDVEDEVRLQSVYIVTSLAHGKQSPQPDPISESVMSDTKLWLLRWKCFHCSSDCRRRHSSASGQPLSLRCPASNGGCYPSSSCRHGRVSVEGSAY